ncbi:MAG TPA: hypothetical protein VN649_10995 [Ramlibacter sp.]|nr:hypothetical protein [Ramlibacter sp.]
MKTGSCHCGRRFALLAAGCACCALIAGCAQTGGRALVEGGPGVMQPQGIAPAAAQSSIVAGKSTKADVMATLGQPTKIPFDSGYEVWLYRWPGAQKTHRAATELVVLFEPAGIVKKTRVRPGYAPQPQ